MRPTIVHPWVSLSIAPILFIVAFAGGAFFVEGIANQVVAVPVRDKYQVTSPRGIIRVSRKRHSYIYFWSLTIWGAGTVGAGVGGVFLRFQAAHDRKFRKKGSGH